MHRIFSVLLFTLMISCSSSTIDRGPMTGTPVEGSFKAYEEMCAREPESVLCPQEEEDVK